MAAPYYQYGYVDPGRPRAEARECRLNEPILYTYMVPPPEQAVAQQPPQPPAPPAPPALPPVQPPAPPPPDQGAVTVTGPAAGQTAQGGIQIGMTQHIYSNVPIVPTISFFILGLNLFLLSLSFFFLVVVCLVFLSSFVSNDIETARWPGYPDPVRVACSSSACSWRLSRHRSLAGPNRSSG